MSYNAFEDCRNLNKVWGNYVLDRPSMSELKENNVYRLVGFNHILSEELNELNEIILKIMKNDYPTSVDTLTDLADWFGDMIVYLIGESAKYGIRVEDVIKIINDSNRSKLSEEGSVIRNPVTMKVEKGPNYWKPEPKIKEYLQSEMF